MPRRGTKASLDWQIDSWHKTVKNPCTEQSFWIWKGLSVLGHTDHMLIIALKEALWDVLWASAVGWFADVHFYPQSRLPPYSAHVVRATPQFWAACALWERSLSCPCVWQQGGWIPAAPWTCVESSSRWAFLSLFSSGASTPGQLEGEKVDKSNLSEAPFHFQNQKAKQQQQQNANTKQTKPPEQQQKNYPKTLNPIQAGICDRHYW